MDNPRARHDLEFIPIDYEGKQMILVRDRLGLVPYGTGVPRGLLPILALMDGTRSLADLAREITTLQNGRAVAPEDIGPVLDELDAAGLLDTARYREAKAQAAADFAASPLRPAVFAGPAYPDNPELLRPYLDAILDLAAAEPAPPAGEKILGLIAPHIDPEAGKTAYAAAYAPLRGHSPKRVIVLGVGHQIIKGLYSLTDKAYATPLGQVPADAAAVERLRRAGAAVVDPGDLQHRDEHSVEFQAVFLRHVLGDAAAPFAFVPILCGSPLGALQAPSRRAFLEAAGPFLDALRELAAEADTLVVAGVDFCHIGPKFGHDKPAELLEEAALAHDAALLDALSRGDAEAFWAESTRVEDSYNVCGLTALATLAEILPPAQLTVLRRDIMREKETASAVTFAAGLLTAR